LLCGVWLAETVESGRAGLTAGARAVVLADGRVVTAAGVRGGGRPSEPLELVAREREASRRTEMAVAGESAALDGVGAARARLEHAVAAARSAGATASEARRLALDESGAARAAGPSDRSREQARRVAASARLRGTAGR